MLMWKIDNDKADMEWTVKLRREYGSGRAVCDGRVTKHGVAKLPTFACIPVYFDQSTREYEWQQLLNFHVNGWLKAQKLGFSSSLPLTEL